MGDSPRNYKSQDMQGEHHYFSSTATQIPEGVSNPEVQAASRREMLPARAHTSRTPFGAASRGWERASGARAGRAEVIKDLRWEPLRNRFSLLQLLAREGRAISEHASRLRTAQH